MWILLWCLISQFDKESFIKKAFFFLKLGSPYSNFSTLFKWISSEASVRTLSLQLCSSWNKTAKNGKQFFYVFVVARLGSKPAVNKFHRKQHSQTIEGIKKLHAENCRLYMHDLCNFYVNWSVIMRIAKLDWSTQRLNRYWTRRSPRRFSRRDAYTILFIYYMKPSF